MPPPPVTVIAGGDIFDGQADILVNPVNTQGTMGAGLAKQFRKRYPEIDAPYRRDCQNGQLVVGTVGAYPSRDGKTVICLPTKIHWRNPSRPEHIQAGLTALARWTQQQDCRDRTIAIPPLGCGLGGLDWADIEPMVHAAAASMTVSAVRIYAPTGTVTH